MMWPFDRAPAAHIKREYVKPQSLAETFSRYATVAQLPANHGVDPYREARRRQALANGPFRISPIAQTSGPLPHQSTGWDDRRRVWRFRGCDPVSGRLVWEGYVEGETPEAALAAGRQHVERHAVSLGLTGTRTDLVASILTV